MQTVTVEEAQSRLAELIATLSAGEEVVITRDDKPVATIRAAPPVPPRPSRRLGTLKGSVISMSTDFDSIPEGFEEYVG